MIYRPDYINVVAPFIDKPLVKILAGVRRCGKSTILEMLREELLRRGIPEDHIIQKRYTEMDIPESITAKAMYEQLRQAMEERRSVTFCWMRSRRSGDGKRQSTPCWRRAARISMSPAPIPSSCPVRFPPT